MARLFNGKRQSFVLYPSPRRTSWRYWEQLGVPTSCLIVAYDAFCQVGRAKVEFRALCGGRSISIPLYRERIKKAVALSVKGEC
ncbi:PaRep2a protein [Pyrobaculum aerophilum]|uniref:PaRep2a protein n=1 Tax=Pyrobaculum aerophilum TaxID=13773 RepID=UPI002162C63D|nr:PaRep2a protein [Pyrobaculum aerophilum]